MAELHLAYAVVGVLGLVLAALAARIRELPLSEPLLAMLLGVAVGPAGLSLVDLPERDRAPVLLEVSRVLLAVSLMAVALRYPSRSLRPLVRPVSVLVVGGMVGMAALTTGLAFGALGIPLALAVLLAACLTPTDPVLAGSVVTGAPAERDLPERTRQLLSTESGANDGLAYAFVVVGIAVVLHHEPSATALELLYGVLAAVALGVGLGVVAAKTLDLARRHGEVDPGSLLVFTLVLAVAALGLARLARTDAVLAVLVTGLAYNVTVSGGERAPEQRVDEALNRYLLLPLFLLLGVELPWAGWAGLGGSGALFVAAVLLLRRLPVVLALRPVVGLRLRDAVFLGWFGPIGVSALFYLTHAEHEGVSDPVLWTAGTAVVAASTLVHGVTSAPGRRAYARTGHRRR